MPKRWLSAWSSHKTESKDTAQYHAVSIRCVKRACPAAHEAQGVRHLSADAPLLPLKKCNRPDQCECRYEHHDDRRSGEPRRAAEIGLPEHGNDEQENRRNVKGRRAEDHIVERDPLEGPTDYYEHTSTTIRKRSPFVDASSATSDGSSRQIELDRN